MLRAVLVGLDGSAYSEAAAELALTWCRRFAAKVIGLTVIEESAIPRAEPIPLGAAYYKSHRDELLLQEAGERSQRVLERFRERCESAQVLCETRTRVGEAWREIFHESQRCDLVVLGKQTYFRSPDTECDTLYRALHNTARPVVAVPKDIVPGSVVVIAYDGSLQAARALQLFVLLRLYEGQEVHVISVTNSLAEATEWTERAASFLRHHGVPARIHPLVSLVTNPSEILLQQIQECQGGLVVLGAYGKPFLREFFLGSVTRSMLQQATVPLFMYH